MSEPLVYLDNNATTRVDDRVVEAMVPLLNEQYGNPSSTHRFGAGVNAMLEEARGRVAGLIGARDSEIVFTSGGTEADNMALRGLLAARPSRRHVVISTVEHHAVFELAEQLEREGVEVSRVGVDREGRLDLDQLRDSIRDDTAAVAVMLANNETGVVFDVRAAAEIVHERGSRIHCDAVQAVGKIPVNVDDLGVDLLALSGHKIHGPKGAGALYVRRGTPLRPMMFGGHQERGRRGGTQNTAGIVGLGMACEIIAAQDAAEHERIRGMRDRLERDITQRFESSYVVGERAERLPNTACICFAGIEAEAALLLLSEANICVSSGAACSSGSLEPSHVLGAMGIEPRIAQGEIRISVSRYNTDSDVESLLSALPRVIEKLSVLTS